MVFFATGLCSQHCFYCPISDLRKGKKQAWANERPIHKNKDFLDESREMRATGMGVTGGDPLCEVNKVCGYIRLAKQNFGGYHVHLYTYGDLVTEKNISLLEKAGLDEIRFHALHGFEGLRPAMDSGMGVGIEVPCIPGDWKRLKSAVEFAADNGLFLNLNEFEYSDTNEEEMNAHGFKQRGDGFAAEGSRELGEKTVRYAKEVGGRAHFCSVHYKYAGQLVKRLRRRAETIKCHYEKVNRYGYLVRGVVDVDKAVAKRLGLDWVNGEARASVEDARRLANKYNAFKVVEYPSAVPWVFEKTRL
ncbi:MAG: radical SAM protein [Candidatus Diapherotrites archaeon]|nr:radical SAM protein [Candidatus Diapherotrites archaeon]